MTTKKVLTGVAAVTVALFSLSAMAGHHGGKKERDPAAHLAKLTERLDLDENQVPQIEVILNEAQAKRQAIGDRYTLNQRDEARAEMRVVREETQAAIAAVLTDEQNAKLEEMKSKRRDRGRHRRGNRDDAQAED